MVIVRPAMPSEMVKLDPIDVSRPMGRISVVTIEKIPNITDSTASQDRSAERAGGAEASSEVAIAVEDMAPVLCVEAHHVAWPGVGVATTPAGREGWFWRIRDATSRGAG
ncbi:hypothetical protein GCM10010388_20640 [Streptomyces mauvecolor]